MEGPRVSGMPEQPAQASDGGDALSSLDELEQRVLAMARELQGARAALKAAEPDASVLRERIQERDLEIALLKKQVDGDDLRTTIRARVEALLKRVDELERGG